MTRPAAPLPWWRVGKAVPEPVGASVAYGIAAVDTSGAAITTRAHEPETDATQHTGGAVALEHLHPDGADANRVEGHR